MAQEAIVPENGKFYWVEYVGPLPRLAGGRAVARLTAASYNQAPRHSMWHLMANIDAYRFVFTDFHVVAGPIEAPL